MKEDKEKLLHLEIATPDRVVFKGNVYEVIVPVEDGMWGILPGHMNTLAYLRIGVMKVKEQSGKVDFFAIGEGFLELIDDNVYITVDSAEKAEEIDILRAKKEKEEIEKLLSEKKAITQKVQLYASLQKALAKLKAVESLEETKSSKER